jgi:hypothetical protein
MNKSLIYWLFTGNLCARLLCLVVQLTHFAYALLCLVVQLTHFALCILPLIGIAPLLRRIQKLNLHRLKSLTSLPHLWLHANRAKLRTYVYNINTQYAHIIFYARGQTHTNTHTHTHAHTHTHRYTNLAVGAQEQLDWLVTQSRIQY